MTSTLEHELRLLSAETIADAFLSCEKRKVDKGGCISFCGQKYEVERGLSMMLRMSEKKTEDRHFRYLDIFIPKNPSRI